MLLLFCVFILFQVIDKVHQCHGCCYLSRDVESGITVESAVIKCQLVYMWYVVFVSFCSDWWSGCCVDIIQLTVWLSKALSYMYQQVTSANLFDCTDVYNSVYCMNVQCCSMCDSIVEFYHY